MKEEAMSNMPVQPPVSTDILRGAAEIAAFLFGDRKYRRRVYHLAGTSRMPFFKIGSMLCVRPSVLMGWIADQEGR
jgi:hypothetical protein